LTEERAKQAGDDDRPQKINRDHAETQPQATVGRGKRNDGRLPSERREGVDDGGHDVNRKEDERCQRQVAV